MIVYISTITFWSRENASNINFECGYASIKLDLIETLKRRGDKNKKFPLIFLIIVKTHKKQQQNGNRYLRNIQCTSFCQNQCFILVKK